MVGNFFVKNYAALDGVCSKWLCDCVFFGISFQITKIVLRLYHPSYYRKEFTEEQMYERNGTLTLVSSATAIANNLSVQFAPQTKTAQTIAVIHEGYINVIPVYNSEIRAKYIPCVESGTKPRHVSTSVTQVMWCDVKRHQLLVVASSLGVQIFDEDGRVCKFSHPCVDMPDGGGNFARGLALIGHDMLCVGNSSGTIRIFHIPEDLDPVVKIDHKQVHKKAVTDIAASVTGGNLVVTADDSGELSLWRLERELHLVSMFPTFRYPCTSLKIWEGFILCAFGSGHIRVFGTKTLSLVCEVAAHARWITAADLAPDTGYFLSVSEDSFVKVWQISKRDGMVR
ncbi:WD repeat-containing protein 54-like isoform X3 [Zootermopsis nevadensis]|uniref:WD repeat-containing protein 54-like isoform X3 n=1 Tax=Zootermopsis nevadensis TaxID=136037 RepID=UPI000B8E4B31|nr:WD repeat-containing protein 54-like isoform X3 [Zootermopsis nevadensis]